MSKYISEQEQQKLSKENEYKFLPDGQYIGLITNAYEKTDNNNNNEFVMVEVKILNAQNTPYDNAIIEVKYILEYRGNETYALIKRAEFSKFLTSFNLFFKDPQQANQTLFTLKNKYVNVISKTQKDKYDPTKKYTNYTLTQYQQPAPQNIVNNIAQQPQYQQPIQPQYPIPQAPIQQPAPQNNENTSWSYEPAQYIENPDAEPTNTSMNLRKLK